MTPATVPAWALAAALHCGAPVAPDTLLVFGQQESGWHQFIVHDNVTGVSLDHDNAAAALATARKWLAKDGNIDVGWTQINFRGPERNGLPLAAAFNACASAHTAAAILADAWEQCPPSTPVAHMSCAARVYNTGVKSAGFTYAARIWKTAAQVVPSIGKILSADFVEAAPGTITDGARQDGSDVPSQPNPNPYAKPAHGGRDLVYFSQ